MDFKFPDVGEGITEGELVRWRVKAGDKVKVDQVIAEVETDKAVVEIPIPYSGKIKKLNYKPGQIIKVGHSMLEIETSGKIEIKKVEKGAGVIGDIKVSNEEIKLPVGNINKNPTKDTSGILAMPYVRRMAMDLGVDISRIKGSGKNGEITIEDVRASTGNVGANVCKVGGGVVCNWNDKLFNPPSEDGAKKERKYDFYGYLERIPFKSIRRTVAKNMVQSINTSAHVTHHDEADVTDLWNLRSREKLDAEKKKIKLTFLAYYIKALCECFKKHPLLNSTLDLDSQEIVIKKYYNIGIAVDTNDGLVVPVIKRCDFKSMLDIAKGIEQMAEKARNKKLDILDLQGGSFTITNYGSIGGRFATPIINFPESAIIGFGRIYEKPVVYYERNASGEKVGRMRVEVRKIQPFSITFDHRILDGAECARFSNLFMWYLENPEKIPKSEDVVANKSEEKK